MGTNGDAEEMCVIIKRNNGCSFSNIPDSLESRLKWITESGKSIEFIRLFDDGEYFIKDSESIRWGGVEWHLNQDLMLGERNGKIHDVALAKDGCWVVIRDDEFSSSVGISEKLDQELTSFYSHVKRAQQERLAKEAAEREAKNKAPKERKRLTREAAEGERMEREEEEQKLVLELQEEYKETEVLEKLIKRRRKEVMLRVESLPPSRRSSVMEKMTDRKISSSSSAKVDDCVVCHDNEAVRAIVPCGHHCLCDSCAAQVMTSVPKTCPLCRESVQMTLKIYRSF